jgi:hypothetical protein
MTATAAFLFVENVKLSIVDERSSILARQHARSWTGVKISKVGDYNLLKQYPKPMCTTVTVCAHLGSRPDAAIVVLAHADADAFAKNSCVFAEGAPVGIILDCASPNALSPNSLDVLAELAAKHNGIFAAFPMSDREQVDAFFHQMIFLARLHGESTRKLRQRRLIRCRRLSRWQMWPRCCIFPSIAITIIAALVYYCCW